MPIINVDIDIYIECADCGRKLNYEFDSKKDTFYIEPCEKCIRNNYDNGFDDGKNEGYNEGVNEGYSSGWEEREEEFNKEFDKIMKKSIMEGEE
jgi:hypothetical protein